MDEITGFEARLAALVRAYGAAADRPFDTRQVVAVATGRGSVSKWDSISQRRRASVLLGLAAIVGLLVLIGVLAAGTSRPTPLDLVFTMADGVYRLDPGGQPVRILERHDPGGVALSPDRRRLAVTFDSTLEIWSADGRDVRIGTGAFGQPAWSPDGQRLLVLVSDKWAIVDPDNGKIDPSSPRFPHFKGEGPPAWSPDSTRIVFEASDAPDARDPGAASHLRIGGVEGGQSSRLTKGLTPEFEPKWSADGRWIAYEAVDQIPPACRYLRITGPADGRTVELYRACAPGDGAALSDGAFPFDWTPDGRRLMYPGAAGDGLQVVDVSDGARSTIVPAAVVMARWSPDGTELAFIDGRGLWVVSADGSNPRPIVAGDVWALDW
jgi:WD40 repeat protein